MLRIQYYINTLVLFLPLLSGCYFGPPRPAGFPKTLYPCRLQIMQEDKPLHGAVVSLIPVDETQKGWSTGGSTDAEGVAEIYTYSKWKGVPPGRFKVVISKEIEEIVRKKEVYFSLVDSQFTSAETTPFEIDIKGKTEQSFDVGKEVKQIIKD